MSMFRRPGPTSGTPDQTSQAVSVARLYYHQSMTTSAIAAELGLSRPKVSRLLSFARDNGIVEIRIHDPGAQPEAVGTRLEELFGVETQVVINAPNAGDDAVLERVANAAAATCTALVRPGMTVGLAWGNTLDAVSHALTPHRLTGLDVVQLNGSATTGELVNGFVTDTITRFAAVFGGQPHLFPVPTFFDNPATRTMMFRERVIRQILQLQQQADLLIYSVGSPHAVPKSHVYASGALDDRDLASLDSDGITGDIATMFFREDGTHEGLALNDRASGPGLGFIAAHPNALCVVSGRSKAGALLAALRGGLMTRLIVDEDTALRVLELHGS